MKKFSGTGHATDNNIIRHMRFTCCLTKAQTHIHTHSEYVIIMVFSQQTFLH